jgi:hypothetical protein
MLFKNKHELNADEQTTCEFLITLKNNFIRMKKCLVLFLLFFTFSGFAQENVIKMGVTGVNYGDFSLSYERAVTPKSAINFTIGYLNPNASLFNFLEETDSSSGMTLRELGTGFHTSFDYKFYTGKNEGIKGFYIAPYLRFLNYNSTFSDKIDTTYFDVDLRFSSIGLGFQLGYQWIVFDKVSIDWYFLGVNCAYMFPKVVYTTANKSSFDYSSIKDDVSEVLDAFSYLQKNLIQESSSKNLTNWLPAFVPGIRTGISIGYAF